MVDALKPSMKALIHDNLLKHSDVDVKVAVASCISEITRITAPDAPYDDNQMRDVFQLIVSSFEDLADQSSRSYTKRASILETVSKVRSCVIMLDLECDELIVKMFEHFLKSVRDYHIDSIFSSMENIMVLVLEESEEIPVEMLKPLLARVKKDQAADESKLTTASSDHMDQVAKEKACPEEEVNPTLDRSPKSVMRNGVKEAGNEEVSVDQELNKQEEDTSQQPLNKNIGDSNTDKLEKAKSQTEPFDSSHAEGSDVQVSSPKAMESKPAATPNVSSPSQSNSLPEERPVRSKKKQVPQEDETASPSNGGSHKNKGLTLADTPEAKKERKKTVIAKEIDPDTVNESEDGEATSDSDAKPLSKTKLKPKSTRQVGKKSKQSGKKPDVGESDAKKPEQTGKKVDAKGEDSDSKPLKTSVKKGEKRKITVEEEDESDSDNKPLTPLAKKTSSKKKDTGKKRGNVKNVTEKDQAKSLSGDDEMDTSAVSVTKSVKGEGNSKEIPVNSAKQKRATGKDNATVKYDESLVGKKIKVWWPEDKMFYEGVVEEFYPARNKHKISYLDGDEETLNLRTQKWMIVPKVSLRDYKEQTTKAQSEDASPGTHKKKKSKTDHAPSASQEKVKDSAKKVGATSSSGKSKKENSAAKSTPETSGKSSDTATPSKEVGNTKGDRETLKTGSKTKAVNKSKGKTLSSGSKSSTDGPPKAKSGLSNVKESDDVKTSDSGKVKSTDTAKGGSKSGKKRKKRS
ncbi:hypothetical protein E3N88_08370 [Mikania micrantha]|uniref:Tudor domain-containing protein n=1 Tax=Mikania micrantha TaxID=192012 RepID=A0A5N6PG33_9ASTR|nr:hypothetical protein E3N88_08370 [Mikania micrantha]